MRWCGNASWKEYVKVYRFFSTEYSWREGSVQMDSVMDQCGNRVVLQSGSKPVRTGYLPVVAMVQRCVILY